MENSLKNEHYQRASREKAEIVELLRKRGFRVTKQRELILDIVLQHECTSCKEIYYQAILQDPGIGMATIYRMVNTLMDIGVLKETALKPQMEDPNAGNGCRIRLKNHDVIELDQAEWMEVLQNALCRKGYDVSEGILEVNIKQK